MGFEQKLESRFHCCESQKCTMFSFFREIGTCFNELAGNPDCRVIILSGAGPKLFTAGIDLNDMISLGSELAEHEDVARKCNVLLRTIRSYQNSLTALEKVSDNLQFEVFVLIEKKKS